MAERSVPEPVLLQLRRSEDIRQSVAEIHRADLAPLGRPDLRLVPRRIIAHTAPHRDGLLPEVGVLPREGADLSDAKSRKAGDPDGKERRVVLLFQPVRQRLVLLIADGGAKRSVFIVLISNLSSKKTMKLLLLVL